MKRLPILFIIIFNNLLFSQQTVGLFLNSDDSYKGYTMFAPIGSTSTYLIDECGEKIHSWNSAYLPGLSAYFLKNGLLLRTGKITNTTFLAGGQGGAIELLDWDSNVIWEYILSNSTECLHHDINFLPNGNILAIAWDLKTNSEALNAGRSTAGAELWSEKIIEIQPDYINDTAIVVWEWKVWDHLVQDIDSTKDNFGNTSSPELININYYSGNATNKDWLHINSVDYNENLDQIILSVHNFNEVWIIDHSTTVTESASETGGIYGKGGNLLYRWGNPESYNHGDSNDKLLYSQHNASWINDTLIDGGMIMIFNNQIGYPEQYSNVNIIELPIDTSGNYIYSGSAFLPYNFHWTYQAPTLTDFYAHNISSAQRLPNGNTLICEGPSGRLFEIDYGGNKLWEYISPISNSGIIEQGDPATQNKIFNSIRYDFDYSGFDNKTLTPQGYIETGSTYTCDSLTNKNEKPINSEINIYPNPNNGKFIIEFHQNYKNTNIQITDITGKLVYKTTTFTESYLDLNIQNLHSGVYVIKFSTNETYYTKKLFIN